MYILNINQTCIFNYYVYRKPTIREYAQCGIPFSQ